MNTNIQNKRSLALLLCAVLILQSLLMDPIPAYAEPSGGDASADITEGGMQSTDEGTDGISGNDTDVSSGDDRGMDTSGGYDGGDINEDGDGDAVPEAVSDDAAEESELSVSQNSETVSVNRMLSNISADSILESDSYIVSANTVIDKIGLDGYDKATDDNKELYAAFEGDLQLERHGGRYFKGHEIIRYDDSDIVAYDRDNFLNLTDDDDDTPFESKGKPANWDTDLVFSLDRIPVEMSNDYMLYSTSYPDSGPAVHNIQKIENTALYAWEYEKDDDGSYRRIKSVPIPKEDLMVDDEDDTMYVALGTTDTEKKTLEEVRNINADIAGCIDADPDIQKDYYRHVPTLKGMVKLNGSDFSDPAHPIAIVAMCYDANDTDIDVLFKQSEDPNGKKSYDFSWDHDPLFLSTGNVDEDKYYQKAPCWDDVPYQGSRMGEFSLMPYQYRMAGDQITLYNVDIYTLFIRRWELGYTGDDWKDKSGAGLVTETWRIPGSYRDPVSGETYDVKLAPGGNIVPHMAKNLVLGEGIGLPDDCSYLFASDPRASARLLTSISFEGAPKSVGSNVKNMSHMFLGKFNRETLDVTNYSSLDIKALDTSNVEDMSSMFADITMTDGQNIDVSGLDTGKVKDFSSMFESYHVPNGYSDPATALDVSNFNTSSAEDMSYMFACTTVHSLDISNFDFSGVKTMQGMFLYDPYMESLTLPSGMDSRQVTNMSYLFEGDSKLATITNLTSMDTDNVTDMTGMFGGYMLGDRKKIETVPSHDDPYTSEYGRGDGMDPTHIKPTWVENVGKGGHYDPGPALSILDLSNFDTRKVQYTNGMLYLPKVKQIIWGDNTTFESVTDAQKMFTLAELPRLDLTGRRFSALEFAGGTGQTMITLDGATELILGEHSLDLSHLKRYGGLRISAPLISALDMRDVVFGDNVYSLCTDSFAHLEGCDRFFFPEGLPSFAAPAEFCKTLFDSEGNFYDRLKGGNTEELHLSASADYEITGIRVADNSSGVLHINSGSIYDAEKYIYLYMLLNGSGENSVAALTPAPDIKWEITGNALEHELSTSHNTDDVIKLTAVRSGTATVSVTVNDTYTWSTDIIVVDDNTAGVVLEAQDGLKYNAVRLSDGSYMITGLYSDTDAVAGNDNTIDLSSMKNGAVISRIGPDAFFDTNGEAGHVQLGEIVKSIKLPASVRTIDYEAFKGLRYLETVEFGVGSRLEKIGDSAFFNCGVASASDPEHKSVHLSMTLPDGLRSIGNNAFSGDYQGSDIETINVPATVERIGEGCFNGCNSLTEIVIASPLLEIIEKEAFMNCSMLSSIKDTEGNEFDFADVTGVGESAFEGCGRLSFSGVLKAPKLTSIGKSSFKNCVSLNGIEAPALRSLGENAFYGCRGLHTAKLPLVNKIPKGAFEGCDLTSVDISSATVIESAAFKDNKNLTWIDIPYGLTNIEGSDYRGAFYNCSSLSDVSLPETVRTIGISAFQLTGITELIIPDGVTSIDKFSFANCSSLEKVTVGSGITEIPDSAFSNSKIRSVVFKGDVSEIGSEAFINASITDLTIPDSVRTIGEKAFDNALLGAYRLNGGEALDNGGLEALEIPYGVTDFPNNTSDLFSSISFKADENSDPTGVKDIYIPYTLKNMDALVLKDILVNSGAPDYKPCGTVYYPGTRAELEALWKTVTEGSYHYQRKEDVDPISRYLGSIEYGTGWMMQDGKLVFLKKGEAVKAERGQKAVQKVGDRYYLLDENGHRIKDTLYAAPETVEGKTDWYVYYFDPEGAGERKKIDTDALAQGEVYGFSNDTVHSAVKLEGGVPELIKGVSDTVLKNGLTAVDSEKYFAFTDGKLAKGYYRGTESDGFYFDDHDHRDGRLLWYADYSSSPVIYYTDETKAVLLGASEAVRLPDENGNIITFRNGLISSLDASDIVFEGSPMLGDDARITLYTGTGAGTDTKPNTITIDLSISEKELTSPIKEIKWSVANSFPRVGGNRVISLGTPETDTAQKTSTITAEAKAAGSARARATITDEAGNRVYRDVYITVKDLDPMPSGISITSATGKYEVYWKQYPKQSLQLNAVLEPAGTAFKPGYDKVTWSTNGTDNDRLIVDSTGKVTAGAMYDSYYDFPEQFVVTATTVNGIKAHVTVTVKKLEREIPVNYIDILDTSDQYVSALQFVAGGYDNGSAILKAKVYPDNATYQDITWRSGNDAIASVTPDIGDPNKALVKGVSKGTTYIYATANDTSGVTTACKVTVTDGNPITVSYTDTSNADPSDSYTFGTLKGAGDYINDKLSHTTDSNAHYTISLNKDYLMTASEAGSLDYGDKASKVSFDLNGKMLTAGEDLTLSDFPKYVDTAAKKGSLKVASGKKLILVNPDDDPDQYETHTLADGIIISATSKGTVILKSRDGSWTGDKAVLENTTIEAERIEVHSGAWNIGTVKTTAATSAIDVSDGAALWTGEISMAAGLLDVKGSMYAGNASKLMNIAMGANGLLIADNLNQKLGGTTKLIPGADIAVNTTGVIYGLQTAGEADGSAHIC
ncbi:MAG: leucine-rich repeat protein, partial [Lachnospiraceae bacterium]|nr:leucine-rich repeat protein [Lachnospiraceae bacterium]